MNVQPLPFRIDPMQPPDIPQVIAIDRVSYAMNWPRKAYDYELSHNNLAHYFVLRPGPPPSDGRLLESSSPIIGLGGFWQMADELHLTTLAIHPRWRRRGLGQWLLIHLLEQGQALGTRVATLEVRPSNRQALSLYRKYNFQETGRRRRYYTNNGEDALILTTPPLALPDYQAMLNQRKAALVHRLTQIKVDKTG